VKPSRLGTASEEARREGRRERERGGEGGGVGSREGEVARGYRGRTGAQANGSRAATVPQTVQIN
jgi:hypothetical protein